MGIESKVTSPMKKLVKLAAIAGGIYLGANFALAIFPAYSAASYYGAAAGGAVSGLVASEIK